MRDPKRIKPFLKELERVWLTAPDLRFTQLIVAIFGDSPSFYLEDDQALLWLRDITGV